MHSSDVRSVVDVVYEFDRFGGASLELVAWELSLPDDALAPGWEEALRRGFLELAGIDDVDGKQTYRLTELGRQAHSRFQWPSA